MHHRAALQNVKFGRLQLFDRKPVAAEKAETAAVKGIKPRGRHFNFFPEKLPRRFLADSGGCARKPFFGVFCFFKFLCARKRRAYFRRAAVFGVSSAAELRIRRSRCFGQIFIGYFFLRLGNKSVSYILDYFLHKCRRLHILARKRPPRVGNKKLIRRTAEVAVNQIIFIGRRRYRFIGNINTERYKTFAVGYSENARGGYFFRENALVSAQNKGYARARGAYSVRRAEGDLIKIPRNRPHRFK